MAAPSSPRPRRKAIEDLGYYHLFSSASNEPIIRLADRVLALFREKAGARHLSKVFFGTSGSDANDTNFKLVRYYNNLLGRPQKKKIISRLGGYHGLTYAAGSLTGIAAYHKAFDLPIDGRLPHLLPALSSASASRARARRPSPTAWSASSRTLIQREGADTVAAFIAEPIMGTGGVFMPPQGLFRAGPGGARRERHPLHRRRGDHRVRPHRRSGSPPGSTI